MSGPFKVVALSGGVGGAKLVDGLARVLPSDDLLVVANTGDDFDHLGLRVCPDVDTIVYTLSDLADQDRGWGRRDETWHFLESLEALGGETWFQLGDRDLAMHVERTRLLGNGVSLTAVTKRFAHRLGIGCEIVPMTNDDVRTIVETPEGILSFQEYFVRERCQARVRNLSFHGADSAEPNELFLTALRDPVLDLVVICPSNPYLSVDPILSLSDVPEALAGTAAPVIAVSPIIAGEAVKGPTAKIMRELGKTPSPLTIAGHYSRFIDGFVLDERDADLAARLEGDFHIPVLVCDTLMTSLEKRKALAEHVLTFSRSVVSNGKA